MVLPSYLCKTSGGGNQTPPPEPLSDDFDDGKYIEQPSSEDLDSVVEEREVKDKTADPEC